MFILSFLCSNNDNKNFLYETNTTFKRNNNY